jgi:hypothetical protein
MERLAQAHRAGPTLAAFTLRERFLPDGSRPAGVAAQSRLPRLTRDLAGSACLTA